MYRFLITFGLLVPSIHATLHIKLDMSGPVLNYSFQGNPGGTSFFQSCIVAVQGVSGSGEVCSLGNNNARGSLNASTTVLGNGYQNVILDMARNEYVNNDFTQPNWVTFNVAGLGPLPYGRITHTDNSGQLLYFTELRPYLPGNVLFSFYVPVDRASTGFDTFTQAMLAGSNVTVTGGNQVIHTYWPDGGDATVQFEVTPEPTSILLLASAVAGSLITARRSRRKRGLRQ